MSESNDEIKLIEERVKLFKVKVHELQQTFVDNDIYRILGQIEGILQNLDTTLCSDLLLLDLLQKNLEAVVNKITVKYYIEEERKHLNMRGVQNIIKKLIIIYSVNKKYKLAICPLQKIFSRKENFLFYQEQKHSQLSFASAFRDNSEVGIQQFYVKSVELIKEEFIKLVKEVWNMNLQDLIAVIEFFISLQKQKQKRTYMTTLLDLYFAQFMAFIQSGRPQIVSFANYQLLNILGRNFSNSIQRVIKREQIQKIIPTLVKTLIIQDKVSRTAGLKLLSTFWKKVNDYSAFNSPQEQKLRQSLLNMNIYQLLLNKNFCEQQEQDIQTIVKFMERDYHQKYKIKASFIIEKLRENNNENKNFSKFCFRLFNWFSRSSDEKNDLVVYLEEMPNVVDNYPLINQTIDDILYRYSSSDPYNERVFRLLQRIMREGYFNLNMSNQKKLLDHFKKSSRGLKTILRFMSSNDEKVKYLKTLAKELLQQISFSKIIIFNIVFNDSEVNGCFGNNIFQGIINYVVQDLNLFSKIFQYIDQNTKVSQFQRDIVKIIKFTTSKCTIKVDVTQKYIKTLAQFPQLYQLLIENEGYQKIHVQMEKVIELFRAEPITPFHILRTTFLKANFKSFSQYKKKYSLLNSKIEQYVLKYEPTSLQFYQQLIILLEQTDNSDLREQLAQFIVNLHLTYESVNKQELIKYMVSILDYFNENTKSFDQKMATKSSVLSNIELIKQMIQMTDILGVGKFRPHNSLVSTSTIYLTIINNATFGDDVQRSVARNFSTNMILFDLLSLVSISFRCGPEDLVLRQGSRVIPIIYNGRTLQDLKFTSQEIIAQKNQLNETEAPEMFKKQYKEVVVNQIFYKCITEIFNRFSFEGKMGEIECMNYLKQVNDSYISLNDRKLKQMMLNYDKDNDGILTLQDFIAYNIKKMTSFTGHYYQEQFKKGLSNLRYRKNLTLPEDPLDISDRYYLMMRFKIQKSPEIYDKLFIYTDNEDEEISQKAKELLMYLPTSNVLKSNIKQIFNFNQNSEFLIYYKLILIESQLNQKCQNLSFQEYKKQKTEKIHEFINNHYNEIIFNQLKKFYQKINQSGFAYKCFTICLKILRSLINIDNLIETNISSLKFSEDLIHLLPSTNFFSLQAIKALSAKNTINFQVLLVLQLTQSDTELTPIIAGCFHDDEQIRKTCCNFLYLWQEKVQWKDNLFEVQIVDQRYIEWFELLCIIIERTDKYDLEKILIHTVSILQKREQTLFNRYDKMMHGYLKILKSIVKKHKMLIDSSKFHKIIEKLLIKAISQKNRSLLYEIMIELNDQILLEYLDNMLSTVKPSQQCEIKTKYVGIKNLGAICYINSIIQQFFMITKFRYLILNRQIPKECQQKLVNNKLIVDDFMYQLQKMYENLQTSQKKYYVPEEFCYAYKDWEGKPINTSIQQDSHQFLNRLIQNVEQACKSDGKLEYLQKILQIKTLTQFQCGECKNRIDKIETHYNCMLQVKEQDSLASSLKKFTQKQQIQGYTCDNCKKKVKQISKRTFFHEMPEVVILNMQRIIYDQMKGDKIKVHSKLTFPMQINFQEYMKHENIEKMETKYRLKGVVIHTGTSEGGHYYSLIRDNNSDGWLKFNDQNVVPFDEKEIAREGFGGFQSKDNHFQEITYSTNAYILFYQSTANKKNQFLQIQNKLSLKVEEENQVLIKQIQVHQECFFEAINNLYQKHRLKNSEEHMKDVQSEKTSQNAKKDIFLKLISVYRKALDFLQVYTSVKTEIKTKIFSNMLQLYRIQKQQSIIFIENISFDKFWEQLIPLKDQFTRENFLLVFKANLFFYLKFKKVKMDEDTEETQRVKLLIDVTLEMLNSLTLYSNISKAGVLFQFIHELIDYSEDIKIYFISRNIMFRLLDLIMGRQSTYMKYHSKAQDIPKDFSNIIFNILGKLIIYKKNIKGHRFNKQNPEIQFETTPLEAKILMSPSFYRRIFRLNYNHEILGSLIFQYSYADLDYTIMIADILLHQLNKLDTGEVALLFKQIQIFLNINDDLQELRYSFILGFPQYISTGGGHQFCLGISDKSQTVTYVSGIYTNKDDWIKLQNDRRPLLQIVFCEKGHRNSSALASYYGLQMLVVLAQGSEKAFRYLKSIPPPNYLKLTLFDLIPVVSSRLIDNQNFIIDSKLIKLTQINQMYSMIQQRLKIMEKQFPVQKYIIGKTKSSEEVTKLDHQYFACSLRQCLTYVLDNVPLGNQNKSMGKSFQYQNRGLGNFFLEYRSNLSNCQQKIEIKPTVYILKGKAKHKLLLRFKNEIFNYVLLLSQDEFSINMPFYREGKIQDLVNITLYKEPEFHIGQEQLKSVFQKMMEQQKKDDDPAKPIMMDEEKALIEQGKIACPMCTYQNDITKQRCDMCQNFLFL